MNRRLSTQRAVRYAALAALLVLAGVAVSYQPIETSTSYAQADEFDKISHTVSGNVETWRIDKPDVKFTHGQALGHNRAIKAYPQIQFKPGDRITIRADGCVQTGGHGNTWKRYVNPSGPDADHLYHGLIWIPGVIGRPAATGVPPDPQRIVAYVHANESVTVPSGVDAKQLYLRLGYEDDVYHDNGYYAHDDGTQNQCKLGGDQRYGKYGGPAWVEIKIEHGVGGGTVAPPAPFDLFWTDEDDNGVPLNAKWGWQITHPGALPDPNQCTDGPHKSPCTNWGDVINFDTSDICKAEQYEPGHDNSPPLYGIAGHANWAAGTYVGAVTWETHSACYADDDYNFKFYPIGGAALTDTRDNLETEFDSDETIDNFNTPWWNAFHNAVDNSDAAARQMVTGRYAIVTGLIGLEMCHSGSTELHPVWAMAIRVKDDDPGDEVWAMFVRRWGDEGFCSGDQHYLTGLPGNTYTFRLPWRPGASSVNVLPSSTFQASNDAPPVAVQSAPNQGVLVSFTLPEPKVEGVDHWSICVNCTRINGELHLQWPGGRGPAPLPGTASVRPFTGAVAARAASLSVLEPEKRLASMLAKSTSVQRNQYVALFPRPAVSRDARPLRVGAISRIQSLPKRAARARRVQYKSVPDAKKAARNQRILEGLHKLRASTAR